MSTMTTKDYAFAQLAARAGALKLEIRGMHRSGGRRSAYSICKSEYGLHGSRERVLAQMEEMIEAAIADRETHLAAELTGGSIPAHAPGSYPRLSCCGGDVGLVPA